MTTPADRSEITTPAVRSSWSRTRMAVTMLAHKWTIDDFAMRPEETGQRIRSPTFSGTEGAKGKWCLFVYPKGYSENWKDYVSAFLAIEDRDFEDFVAKVDFAVLNAEGRVASRFCGSFRYSNTSRGWGYGNLIGRGVVLDADKNVLLHGAFRIVCSVSAFAGTVNTSGVNEAAPEDLPQRQLSRDLGRLLSGGRCSDVVLGVGGREMRAHKSVLAARSVVFAAMFEHDMEENKRGRVDITDLDHDVVSQMLQFVYTGSVDDVDAAAPGLLAAGDKYALGGLKAMCERSLCAQVTVASAAELLLLADQHSADLLKASAMDMILTRAHDVMATPGWKTLSQQRPHILAEAFGRLATSPPQQSPAPLRIQMDF